MTFHTIAAAFILCTLAHVDAQFGLGSFFGNQGGFGNQADGLSTRGFNSEGIGFGRGGSTRFGDILRSNRGVSGSNNFNGGSQSGLAAFDSLNRAQRTAVNFQDEDLLNRNNGVSFGQNSFRSGGSRFGGFNNLGRSTGFGSDFFNRGSGFGRSGFGLDGLSGSNFGAGESFGGSNFGFGFRRR